MAVADNIMGVRHSEIDARVTDVIRELTNTMAGNALAQLEHFAMRFEPPNVVLGKSHCLQFPDDVMPICVPLESDWGPVSVEVGLIEEEASQLATV